MNRKLQSFFIRPHRQTYYPYDLGSPILTFDDKTINRVDFHLLNRNQHKISVSFYQLESQLSHTTVIYLHTHHGSKLQGLYLLQPLIKANFNVCLFDFAGYGNSEGETVTMGVEEIWDIDLVIQNLQSQYEQKNFILWGRSMGAVAALLYLYRCGKMRKNIIAGVFDSPFHSLEKLTLEIGSKSSGFPQTILKPLLYFIKKSLEDKIDFEELELVERMNKIQIPGIFITSKKDQFVNYEHSQILYQHYKGKKQLYYIEQDHNQPRKPEDFQKIFEFLNQMALPSERKFIKVINNSLNFIKKYGDELYQVDPSKLIFSYETV